MSVYCRPPYTPHLYSKVGVYRGIHIFLIFVLKHRWWVLVRIASLRCREEIASALNGFGNRWCKRESGECNAMKEWKLSIFNIVDKRIKFYSQNTNLLPP